MARVRIVKTLHVRGKKYVIKRVYNFMPVLTSSLVEATAVQLRILAEEARELILDRLLEATPAPPGRSVVKRPPMVRRLDILAAKRSPFRHRKLSPKHIGFKANYHRKPKLVHGDDGRGHWNYHRPKFKANGGMYKRLDGRALIMTGDLLKGIEVFRGEQTDAGVYYMVRVADRLHKPLPGSHQKPMFLTRLARLMEFGSHDLKLKKREVWRPTMEDITAVMGKLKKSIEADGLRRALRRIA